MRQREMPEKSRDEYERAIDQWILGRNSERDRTILRMYLFDGVSYLRMQERLDEMGYPLSIDRLKRIIWKRKEELFRHL